MVIVILAFVLLLSLLVNVFLILRDHNYDGKIVITKSPTSGKSLFSLEIDGDPYDMQDKKAVLFKVDNQLSSQSEDVDLPFAE